MDWPYAWVAPSAMSTSTAFGGWRTVFHVQKSRSFLVFFNEDRSTLKARSNNRFRVERS